MSERINGIEKEMPDAFDSEIKGKTVSSFSFGANDETIVNDQTPAKGTLTFDVPEGLMKNGITPSIDGEYFDTKRTHQFRKSTLRKLNLLKANHPNVNVYYNSIIDAAICHYYDFIFTQGGTQK